MQSALGTTGTSVGSLGGDHETEGARSGICDGVTTATTLARVVGAVDGTGAGGRVGVGFGFMDGDGVVSKVGELDGKGLGWGSGIVKVVVRNAPNSAPAPSTAPPFACTSKDPAPESQQMPSPKES